ncbi:hypothetical protein E2C01_003310 [Portunus trituberculatus]|uniref:Uncharacterized protein n=1 Tax=Portunus trituberculatus TaxID=210409 RepID=A0A5B7CPG2_PORTR|nr:hypothetical protein [Portunus trituberculatus]
MSENAIPYSASAVSWSIGQQASGAELSLLLTRALCLGGGRELLPNRLQSFRLSFQLSEKDPNSTLTK